MTDQQTAYLGDGVYARIQDGMIKLGANHHEAPTDVIWLEESVLQNLIQFAERVGMLERPNE